MDKFTQIGFANRLDPAGTQVSNQSLTLPYKTSIINSLVDRAIKFSHTFSYQENFKTVENTLRINDFFIRLLNKLINIRVNKLLSTNSSIHTNNNR